LYFQFILGFDLESKWGSPRMALIYFLTGMPDAGVFTDNLPSQCNGSSESVAFAVAVATVVAVVAVVAVVTVMAWWQCVVAVLTVMAWWQWRQWWQW
jgi:hypothetical protein